VTYLTEAEYEILADALLAKGANIIIGKHEGSTIELGDLLLARSDGAFWLMTQRDDAACFADADAIASAEECAR